MYVTHSYVLLSDGHRVCVTSVFTSGIVCSTYFHHWYAGTELIFQQGSKHEQHQKHQGSLSKRDTITKINKGSLCSSLCCVVVVLGLLHSLITLKTSPSYKTDDGD